MYHGGYKMRATVQLYLEGAKQGAHRPKKHVSTYKLLLCEALVIDYNAVSHGRNLRNRKIDCGRCPEWMLL